MRYAVASGSHELVRGRAQVGGAEIIVCTDGTALFDGGAMFGVVPKTLWSRKVSADAQNRIAIGLNCVVVRIGGKTLLIETGFGNKLTPKLREIYGAQSLLPESLREAGIALADVDIVINSHLHWDHCSWNTTLQPDGSVTPTFPNAQYIAHQGEVEHGRQQFERDRISYVADNYEPLIANGQMRLVESADFSDGRCHLMDGVWLEIFPGHTEQLMTVHVESEGEHACFVSDLVPTSAHLEPTWAMGYDLAPLRTTEERKRFYARAIAEQWLVLFPHDHDVPMTKLLKDERGKVIAEQQTKREKISSRHSAGAEAKQIAPLGPQESHTHEQAMLAMTRELEQSRESFQSFVDALPVEAYIKDKNGRFVFYNQQLAKRFCISKTEWIGKTSYDLWSREAADQLTAEDRYVMETGKSFEGNVALPNSDGSMNFWKIIKVRFNQGGVPMMAGVGIDLTAEQLRERNLEQTKDDLRNANRRLQHLSVTDELTDLWNRRAFGIRIAEEMAVAHRMKSPLTLALIDLDNFKAINDSFGHPYGDHVLRQMAEVLRTNKRVEDIAVRYGGEEFALLLPRSDQAAAAIVCERLLTAMREYPWEKRPVNASIGIATLEDDETAEQLAHRADLALYRAKRTGKARLVAYSPELEWE
ncbi:MAG: diguanylate cyclase [Acidobacteria bacterium]|nr:diguanylate cyclase [Acidobacteriota bacterium]